jgi:hypothetical protein
MEIAAAFIRGTGCTCKSTTTKPPESGARRRMIRPFIWKRSRPAAARYSNLAFIFIAFRSFQNLLTPEAQRRSLVCVRRHLAPNGKAIINLFDPKYDLILPGRHESVQLPRDVIHPVSGNRVLVETLERVNDPLTQTFKEHWRFTETAPNGEVVRQEEEYLELRWTFRYEMRHLVESCGLVVEAEYSDFQRSSPEYGKEQIWVLNRQARSSEPLQWS